MAKPFSKTVIHNTDAKLSKQVRQPLKTNQGIHKALTWRVVDIAVGAAVGTAAARTFADSAVCGFLGVQRYAGNYAVAEDIQRDIVLGEPHSAAFHRRAYLRVGEQVGA